MVAQLTLNQLVVGSTPTTPTIKKEHLQVFFFKLIIKRWHFCHLIPFLFLFLIYKIFLGLCKEALLYKSKISFKVRNVTANAKSVLSVLGACVKCGDEIELICDGADEQEAMAAITELINSGLGE